MHPQYTPTLTLNNGVELPAVGYGVFQTPPAETAVAVEAALRAGYRHVDTAAAYANEAGVGDAIRRSGVGRHGVFIETKVAAPSSAESVIVAAATSRAGAETA
jgi:diketogulonate reductase-like aldo/keto reductase